MTRKTNTAGITMIEMLVWIGVLSVIVSAVSVTYVAMLKYLRKENGQVQLLIDVQQAQRRIVHDVRHAIALPGTYAFYKADASTLICRVAASGTTETGTPNSHIVIYTLAGPDHRNLVRKVFDENSNLAPYPEKVLIEDLDSLIFDRLPDGETDTVRCTITVPEGRMHTGRQTAYSFVAGKRNE